MKLRISDVRNFSDDVKNIHDISLWKNTPFGLYEVTTTQCNERLRFLVSWGIDENFPNSTPIVFSMPFPSISVSKEEASSIIEKDPMQLVQFDGTAITGDVLLKAIAISQNPELALKLLNQ